MPPAWLQNLVGSWIKPIYQGPDCLIVTPRQVSVACWECIPFGLGISTGWLNHGVYIFLFVPFRTASSGRNYEWHWQWSRKWHSNWRKSTENLKWRQTFLRVIICLFDQSMSKGQWLTKVTPPREHRCRYHWFFYNCTVPAGESKKGQQKDRHHSKVSCRKMPQDIRDISLVYQKMQDAKNDKK